MSDDKPSFAEQQSINSALALAEEVLSENTALKAQVQAAEQRAKESNDLTKFWEGQAEGYQRWWARANSRANQAEAQVADLTRQLAQLREDYRIASEAWEQRAEEQDKQLAKMTKERDAYRKAKQENDERFQLEAGEARAQLAEATAGAAETQLVLNQVYDYCALLREQNYCSLAVPLQEIVESAPSTGKALAERYKAMEEIVKEARFLLDRVDGLIWDEDSDITTSTFDPLNEALDTLDKLKEGQR